METVPGRPKVEENLPNQSTANKLHLRYLRAEKLKNQNAFQILTTVLRTV